MTENGDREADLAAIRRLHAGVSASFENHLAKEVAALSVNQNGVVMQKTGLS